MSPAGTPARVPGQGQRPAGAVGPSSSAALRWYPPQGTGTLPGRGWVPTPSLPMKIALCAMEWLGGVHAPGAP